MDLATTTTTPTQVDAAEVVARLHELGLGPEIISLAVPLSTQQIRGLISVRRSVKSPEQQALTDDVRKLTHLAIRKATTIIEFGPPEHRLALIRTIIANATKLVSVEEDQTTEELRAEFNSLMSDMKDVAPDEDVITDDFIPAVATENEEDSPHAAEIGSPTPSSYYQDHEHGVPTSRFELR